MAIHNGNFDMPEQFSEDLPRVRLFFLKLFNFRERITITSGVSFGSVDCLRPSCRGSRRLQALASSPSRITILRDAT